MTHKGILIFLLIIATSCAEGANNNASQDQRSEQPTIIDSSSTIKGDTTEKETIDHASAAKEWLKRAVKEYFNQELNERATITTPAYDEYKDDMINSVYSHGIPLDSLKVKWSHKYEVTEENLGVGFLIGAQDYYKIEVQSCTILPSEKHGEYKLKLILCDTGHNQCFESDVTVIDYNGSYAIDDVKEYY